VRHTFAVLSVVAMSTLLPAHSVQAQMASASPFGIVGGVSVSTLKGKDVLKGTESRVGMVAGVSYSASLLPHVELEIDALYTDRGFRIPRGVGGVTNDYAVDIGYLDVPVLLKIGTNDTRKIDASFIGGVGLNIKFRCAIEYKFAVPGSHQCEGLADASQAKIERFDVPLIYGVGIRFPVSAWQLSFEARAHHGTRKVEKYIDGKNRTVTLSLGVRRARAH
jgi:hypothetical protein